MKQRTGTSHTRWPIALLAILMPILYGVGGSATAIGDQVELKATHQAGVPFHNAPGGTHDFQRIPDGTRANVIDHIPSLLVVTL